MVKVLELGAGRSPLKPDDLNLSDSIEVTHVDLFKLPDIEFVFDLEKKSWPFEDAQYDVLKASHVLEHLSNLTDVMQEAHRVLRPGGFFCIDVPYYRNAAAFFDPTHKRFFTVQTFDYWDPRNRRHREFGHFVKGAKFFVRDKSLRLMLPLIYRFKGLSTTISKTLSRLFLKRPGLYDATLSKIFEATEVKFLLQKPGEPREGVERVARAIFS